MNGERMISIDRRMLDKTRLGVTVRESMHVSVEPDVLTDQLVHHLEAFVLTEQVVHETREVTLRVPDGWWQTLKAEWMRDWILRRWPVRYRTYAKTVTFDKKYGYPSASISVPVLGPHVVYETITESAQFRR